MAIFIATHKKTTLFLAHLLLKHLFFSLKTEIQGSIGLLHFFSHVYSDNQVGSNSSMSQDQVKFAHPVFNLRGRVMLNKL